MTNKTNFDESTWLRPTSEDFQKYFSENYAELLDSHGFSNVSFKGQRWIRVVDDSILQSVQFIPYHTMFYLYFGCQPLFYPVVFPQKRIEYHDRRQSFFDADCMYRRNHYRRNHEQMPYWGTPLYPGTMEPAVRHWRNVINETVLRTLNSVTDLPTCHSFYQEYRSQWFSNAQNAFDGRYLLECVALHDDAECMRICDNILAPLLKMQGSQYRVCFALKWPKMKADDKVCYGMLVSDLIEDLTGDRSILRSMMKKTDEQSRSLLKKVLSECGQETVPCSE